MSDQEIGKRVALLRAPMSQQAVADAMRERGHDWYQSTVYKVEYGDRPLRMTEAMALAAALGVSLLDIAGIDTEVASLLADNNNLRKRIDAARAALN